MNEEIHSSLNISEVAFEHPLYPIELPREEGYLKVSDKHSIFYAVYGNPKGLPVVILHGGPGAGCDDSLSRFFDLQRWNLVMFDQRGAVRSKPLGCMEENTPDHLIADIEALRKHLGIGQWVVFGGSWGSALAALYGQAHPTSCLGFILRGIFLAREQDYLHLLGSMGKVFPEAYDEFYHFIPEEERHDLLSAYYHRVMDPDPTIHLPAARIFMKYDMICATHLPNPAAVQKSVANDRLTLSVTKAFLYYSKHHFFLQPNQILNDLSKVEHLPAIIVHGRWDAVCLPEMAYLVHKKWKKSTLWMVPQGGHSAHDPAIASALATAGDRMCAALTLRT